jgi:hypothetical protein
MGSSRVRRFHALLTDFHGVQLMGNLHLRLSS